MKKVTDANRRMAVFWPFDDRPIDIECQEHASFDLIGCLPASRQPYAGLDKRPILCTSRVTYAVFDMKKKNW